MKEFLLDFLSHSFRLVAVAILHLLIVLALLVLDFTLWERWDRTFLFAEKIPVVFRVGALLVVSLFLLNYSMSRIAPRWWESCKLWKRDGFER